jgi:hypothetical protein
MMWWRGRVLFLTFWQSAANGSIPPIVSNAAPATGAPSGVHEGLNAVTRYFYVENVTPSKHSRGS